LLEEDRVKRRRKKKKKGGGKKRKVDSGPLIINPISNSPNIFGGIELLT